MSAAADQFELTLRRNIHLWRNQDNCTLKPGLETEMMVFSRTHSTFAGIFAILISISGFILNLLFILAILTHRRTRNHVSSPFMLSVSFADFLNSSFNLPVMAVRFLSRNWMASLGDGICQIYPLSFYGTMGASLLSLTMITVNRAFILFFPNKVDRIFSNVMIICKHSLPINSIVILLLCWLTPMSLLILPTLGVYGDVGLNPLTQSCTILKDANNKSVKRLVYVVGFYLPCITLLITNLAMGIKVRKMKKDAKRRTSFRPDEERRAEDRFIKMLGIVFLSFACCFAPAMFVKSQDRCYDYPSLHIVTYIINWCTVIVNPVIYFFRNEKYKAAFLNLQNLVFGKCKKGGEEKENIRVQTIPNIKVDANSSTLENKDTDSAFYENNEDL